MSKLPLEYLRHIFAELKFLMDEVAKISENDFYSSETLKRVFVRSL